MSLLDISKFNNHTLVQQINLYDLLSNQWKSNNKSKRRKIEVQAHSNVGFLLMVQKEDNLMSYGPGTKCFYIDFMSNPYHNSVK